MVRKVKAEIFYHVNRVNKKSSFHTHSLFQIGHSYTTNKENVFTKGTFNTQHDEIDWFEHYKVVMKDSQNEIMIPPKDIQAFYECLVYYRTITQELFLEQTRKDQYPNHPSRNSCLWVVKTIKEAEEWYNEFKGKGRIQIVKLKLTGSIHIANEEYLFGEELLTRDQMAEKAENYWSGKQGYMKKEILFAGTAEIIGII